jgi:hypothetical protein
MTYKTRLILFLLFTIGLPKLVTAQKIENLEDLDLSKLKGQLKQSIKKIKEAEPLVINGGLSLSNVFTYMSQGENPQPYSFVLTGNVMFSIKGYKLPFSFNYSNWKFSNTNPSFRFNKFSFNPKIPKLGLNLIIGDGSMTFSPYTLNGFQFYGLGAERTVGKFKIQAMTGRFMLAVPEDTTNQVTPSFKRWGTGIKVGYMNNNRKIGFAAFYAIDDKNSIPIPQKDEYQFVKPKENLALSIEGGFPLAKQLTWEGEIAMSIITENSAIDDTYGMTKNPLVKLLKSPNATTKVYGAMKSNINYIIGEDGMIGVGYERVAPNYHTLGAYYFTNDFENITINAQHRGKVNIGLNTGMQYDNLDNKKGSSSGRMVVAGNVGFKVIENMDFMMNYSNFQSFTFVRTGFERINQATPFQNIDTLSFSLLTQNATANVNYAMTKDTARPQSLSMNLNYMESDNRRSGITINPQLNNGSKFLNGAMNYSIAFPQKNLTVAAGINGSFNYGGVTNTTTVGPLLTAIKSFFDRKINATGTIAYNVSKNTDVKQQVFTMNFGVNTTLQKQHNLTFNLLGQQRSSSKTPSILTLTATIGYSYTFEKKYKKIPFLKEKKANDESAQSEVNH